MTRLESTIRSSHDRYFDELMGIVGCIERLKDGGHPDSVIDEMERRCDAFGKVLCSCGKDIIREAA